MRNSISIALGLGVAFALSVALTVTAHEGTGEPKIEAEPSKPERIITVRGGGYRFEG